MRGIDAGREPLMSHDNFQPPDTEEDRDAMAEAWFAQREKAGMLVMTREEMMAKLDSHATDAYAEGRKDEREEAARILAWAYRKLMYVRFSEQEDALMLDEIKLILTGGAA
jgi:hypothetical protein